MKRIIKKYNNMDENDSLSGFHFGLLTTTTLLIVTIITVHSDY